MRPDQVSQIKDQLMNFTARNKGRSVSFALTGPNQSIMHVGGDIARPAASVIKLPLFMAALDMIATSADIPPAITRDEMGKTRYASILTAFDGDHSFSLQEIIKIGIITSDNPVAVAVTKLVGFKRVNQLLKDLGCSDHATMQAGFSEAELGPKNRVNSLSTNDCMILLSVIEDRYPVIYSAMANNLRNTRLNLLLPETWEAPHKTGSLDGVVNDIGIVSNGIQKFQIAFLTDNEADGDQTSYEIAGTTLNIANILFGS